MDYLSDHADTQRTRPTCRAKSFLAVSPWLMPSSRSGRTTSDASSRPRRAPSVCRVPGQSDSTSVWTARSVGPRFPHLPTRNSLCDARPLAAGVANELHHQAQLSLAQDRLDRPNNPRQPSDVRSLTSGERTLLRHKTGRDHLIATPQLISIDNRHARREQYAPAPRPSCRYRVGVELLNSPRPAPRASHRAGPRKSASGWRRFFVFGQGGAGAVRSLLACSRWCGAPGGTPGGPRRSRLRRSRRDVLVWERNEQMTRDRRLRVENLLAHNQKVSSGPCPLPQEKTVSSQLRPALNVPKT